MGAPLNVTEWMRGSVTEHATNKSIRFEHEVLIQMGDIDKFVKDPTHAAPMTGTVLWGNEKCPIVSAEFDMLVATTDRSIKHMYYRIVFVDSNKAVRTMLGNKKIHDDPGFDLWGDITTLFMRVYDGEVPRISTSKPQNDPPEYPSGESAGGKLYIPLSDGIHSFLSFESPGSSRLVKLEAVGKFIRFYGGEAFELFWRQSTKKRAFLWATLIAVAIACVGVGGVMLLR
ncbi:MAG TPA: hypothetical protein VGM90_41545 [Kofleriaceae bacterium]|jgi:hypothetical protein